MPAIKGRSLWLGRHPDHQGPRTATWRPANSTVPLRNLKSDNRYRLDCSTKSLRCARLRPAGNTPGPFRNAAKPPHGGIRHSQIPDPTVNRPLQITVICIDRKGLRFNQRLHCRIGIMQIGIYASVIIMSQRRGFPRNSPTLRIGTGLSPESAGQEVAPQQGAPGNDLLSAVNEGFTADSSRGIVAEYRINNPTAQPHGTPHNRGESITPRRNRMPWLRHPPGSRFP